MLCVNVSFDATVISIPLDVYDNWTDVRWVMCNVQTLVLTPLLSVSL